MATKAGHDIMFVSTDPRRGIRNAQIRLGLFTCLPIYLCELMHYTSIASSLG
jgi:hypothetical protein